MKNAKNVSLVVSVALISALTLALVLSAYFLGRSKRAKWEYEPPNVAADYYASHSDRSNAAFEGATNFETALKRYFAEEFKGTFFDKHFGIVAAIGDRLDAFCEIVIKAMSESGIPAEKLDGIATKLNEKFALRGVYESLTGSASGALTSFSEEIEAAYSKLPSATPEECERIRTEALERLAKTLAVKLRDFSLFSVAGKFLSGVMSETGLTEDEIARITHRATLKLGDEGAYRAENAEFVVDFLSSTAFLLAQIGAAARESSDLSDISAVAPLLDQVGALYSRIPSLEGGAEAFEKALGISYDFVYKLNDPEATKLARGLEGFAGETVAFAGRFMRRVSNDVIRPYAELRRLPQIDPDALSVSELESILESDPARSALRIECASAVAKILNDDDVFKAEGLEYLKISGISDFERWFARKTGMQNELSVRIDALTDDGETPGAAPDASDSEIDEDELASLIEEYPTLSEALEKFEDFDIQSLDALDVESDEFESLQKSAETVLGMESYLTGMFLNLFQLRVSGLAALNLRALDAPDAAK